MIHVETIPVGPLQANCYLVWAEGSKTCAVIDPGASSVAIMERAQKLGLTIEAVLLTHGHFDHVGAVRAIHEATRCPVFLHRGDLSQPKSMTGGELCYTDTYEEGESCAFGGVTFTVLSTPGHTEGSVCLQTDDGIFTGDTLFAGSCGRTDFPGGRWIRMEASLKKLKALPFAGAVYPGHGEATTLAAERQSNPYLRGGL